MLIIKKIFTNKVCYHKNYQHMFGTNAKPGLVNKTFEIADQGQLVSRVLYLRDYFFTVAISTFKGYLANFSIEGYTATGYFRSSIRQVKRTKVK